VTYIVGEHTSWLSPCVEVVEYCCNMGPDLLGESLENVSRGIDTVSIKQPLGVRQTAHARPRQNLVARIQCKLDVQPCSCEAAALPAAKCAALSPSGMLWTMLR
jgi:hypothetical protein